MLYFKNPYTRLSTQNFFDWDVYQVIFIGNIVRKSHTHDTLIISIIFYFYFITNVAWNGMMVFHLKLKFDQKTLIKDEIRTCTYSERLVCLDSSQEKRIHHTSKRLVFRETWPSRDFEYQSRCVKKCIFLTATVSTENVMFLNYEFLYDIY